MMAAKSGVFGISSSLVESRVSLFEAISAAASVNSFSLFSTRQHLPSTRTFANVHASLSAAVFEPIVEDEADEEVPRRRRSSNSLRRSCSPAQLSSSTDAIVSQPIVDAASIPVSAPVPVVAADAAIASSSIADDSLPSLPSASIDDTFAWFTEERPSFIRTIRDQAEESMLQATLAEMLRRADPNRLPSSSSLPNVAVAAAVSAPISSSSSSSTISCSYSACSMDTTTFSAWGEEYFSNQTASFDLMATRDSFERAMQDVTADSLVVPPAAAAKKPAAAGFARSGSFLLLFLLASAEHAGYSTDIDNATLAKALASAAESLMPKDKTPPSTVAAAFPSPATTVNVVVAAVLLLALSSPSSPSLGE